MGYKVTLPLLLSLYTRFIKMHCIETLAIITARTRDILIFLSKDPGRLGDRCIRYYPESIHYTGVRPTPIRYYIAVHRIKCILFAVVLHGTPACARVIIIVIIVVL